MFPNIEAERGRLKMSQEYHAKILGVSPRTLTNWLTGKTDISVEALIKVLRIIGVGEKLVQLEQQEQELYNHRPAIGQIADQKAKYAKEMTYYPEAPKELISVTDLLAQQQAILARNGENQRKRENLGRLEAQAQDLQRQMDELLQKQAQVLADLEIARKSAMDLQDESTEELERNLTQIEAINLKVRTNLDTPVPPAYDGNGVVIPPDEDWSVKVKLSTSLRPEGVWLRLPDRSAVMGHNDEVNATLRELKFRSIENCTLYY